MSHGRSSIEEIYSKRSNEITPSVACCLAFARRWPAPRRIVPANNAWSWQMIKITRAAGRLRRRCRRYSPRHVREIKELAHVVLSGVAIGQARQSKSGLDQFQNSRVIGDGMGNERLLRERRDNQQWNAEAGVSEIAGGPTGIMPCRTPVIWQEIHWGYAVRADGNLG